MKRRPDSTPTFWLGDPPPMLTKGQLDLPLVQAPAVTRTMNLHAVRGALDADGGGNAICGAVGSYLANRPDEVNCAACLAELRECDGCGEACDPQSMVESARGAVICGGCQGDEEAFDSTFGPEDEAFMECGE